MGDAMKETYKHLFKMIKGNLNSEDVNFSNEEVINWDEILYLSNTHKILPMVYESVYNTENFKSLNE